MSSGFGATLKQREQTRETAATNHEDNSVVRDHGHPGRGENQDQC